MDGAEYRRKLDLGRGWHRQLERGDHIFVGSAAGEPGALIDQLVAPDGDASYRALNVLQLPHGGSGRLVAAAHPDLRFTGIAARPDILGLSARDSGSYLMSTIYQTAAAIRDGRIPIDVALVQVAPPDTHGRFSLGIAVDFAPAAVERARLVVAQVNPRLPSTQGDCFLDLADIDALVEASRELPIHDHPRPDDQARGVARNVVGLVPSGATIEVGVGEVLTAILEGLGDHRDLALHTGLFIEAMIPLIEAGAITNRYGRRSDRASVANQATADPNVLRFLDGNRTVALMPATYTHNPAVLRSQHRLHAINSTLEVDLLGRVNSEFVNGQRIGSSGGLLDFVRAAREADGGRSVIALRATSKSGRSKIVSRLGSPGCCTVDVDLADVVVTEYGVAELAGQPADERVRRMLAIADPSVREELARATSGML